VTVLLSPIRLSSIRRPRLLAGAVTAIALAGLANAAGAAAAVTPIGPNQIFLGQVNGSSTKVNFDVVCPGPANMGHPADDTVGVIKLQDPIPGFGRTGNASAIAAKLEYTVGTLAVLEPVAKFTTYTTKPVPSSVVTPCSGTGKMIFAPVKGGSGAKSASVPVTFVNIGTTGA
jgi:opacity protein-like surface antigen